MFDLIEPLLNELLDEWEEALDVFFTPRELYCKRQEMIGKFKVKLRDYKLNDINLIDGFVFSEE